jgi:ABC-2 type transport system permease protein
MNNESNAAAAPATREVRPMVWSVRRELWENRSIYLAPLFAAGIVLFGFLISSVDLTDRMRAAMALEPLKQHAVITMPFSVAAVVIMLTSVVVGMFYCLDALYGERRDRSILFWKSLPVSDLTTVLSKLIIPMAVLPLVAFAVIVATQLIMLLVSSLILMGSDLSAGMLWTQWTVFHESMVLLYGLATVALWFAPVYGWLLLVSGWAQRSTLLWAVLPPLAVSAFEKLAFDTTIFWSMLKFRLTGSFSQAFVVNAGSAPAAKGAPRQMHIPEAIPDPMHFLSSPGLWLGLLAAVALIAAVIWMRRYRDPI